MSGGPHNFELFGEGHDPDQFDEPHGSHLNQLASDELEKQSQRARKIIEYFAVGFAIKDDERDIEGLVEAKHIQQAADLLFYGTSKPSNSEHKKDVFISFSSVDEEVAREISKALEEGGVPSFIACRDLNPGDEWWDEINSKIGDCKLFLAFVTPGFLRSWFCCRETDLAKQAQKAIVPVLRQVEHDELPEPLMSSHAHVFNTHQQLEELVVFIKKKYDSVE